MLPRSRLFSGGAPGTVKSNGFSAHPFAATQEQPRRGEHSGFFPVGRRVHSNPMVFRLTPLLKLRNSPGGVNTRLLCKMSMVFAAPVSAFFPVGRWVQLNPMVFQPIPLPRPKNSPGVVNTPAFFCWSAGYNQIQWFFGLPLCRGPKEGPEG